MGAKVQCAESHGERPSEVIPFQRIVGLLSQGVGRVSYISTTLPTKVPTIVTMLAESHDF